MLARLEPGRDVSLHLFRDDRLLALTLTPVAPPADTWTLSLAEVDADCRARRDAWFGGAR